MYIRELLQEIRESAEAFPIVTILGPRQSGKTTLVKSIFSNKPYVNLELLDTRELALNDPVAFIKKYADGAIFDEVQRAPELLSYLQVLVDEQQQPGKFILTGSHQLKLQEAISQSLAGRTSVLTLFPLSLREMTASQLTGTLEQHLLTGGYPRLQGLKISPTKYYSAYCQTYLERDVKLLTNVKDLSMFRRFMSLCAARIGTIINATELADNLGVTAYTINAWLSALEASFLIFRLPPYFENFGKRIIKSPKLYFSDIGLASYLLGIESTSQLELDPARGRLTENLIILELYKTRYNQGLTPNIFHYRDKSQLEVDAIIQRGSELIPIEIKASETFRATALKGLKKFRELTHRQINRSYLVYAGDIEQEVQAIKLINYQHTAQILEETS